MSLLVPKNRKPRFKVHLVIHDLTNVPLVSGLVHVRWHLRDSIRSEARGKTDRAPIKDHKVEWGYDSEWSTKLVIDRQGHLQEALTEFEVFQEMYGGKERHTLGKLTLNLAEYASKAEEVSRRYLLQDSKVNSTIRLGIRLVQVSGDQNFTAPELKRAQVFGGITGLLSEGKEMKSRSDRAGLTNVMEDDEASKEFDHDLYRNSLTRRWQAQAGELDPVDVIDDIFNGHDGWTQIKDGVAANRTQAHHMHKENLRHTSADHDADDILRSVTWTIDAASIEKSVERMTKARIDNIHAQAQQAQQAS